MYLGYALLRNIKDRSVVPSSKLQLPPWPFVPHPPSLVLLLTTLYKQDRTSVGHRKSQNHELKTKKTKKNKIQITRSWSSKRGLHNSITRYLKGKIMLIDLFNRSPNSSAFFSFSVIISCVRASGGKVTSVGRGARGGGLANGCGINALSLLKASSNDMA